MSLKCNKFLCYLNMENEFLGVGCLLAFTNATIQVKSKNSIKVKSRLICRFINCFLNKYDISNKYWFGSLLLDENGQWNISFCQPH